MVQEEEEVIFSLFHLHQVYFLLDGVYFTHNMCVLHTNTHNLVPTHIKIYFWLVKARFYLIDICEPYLFNKIYGN